MPQLNLNTLGNTFIIVPTAQCKGGYHTTTVDDAVSVCLNIPNETRQIIIVVNVHIIQVIKNINYLVEIMIAQEHDILYSTPLRLDGKFGILALAHSDIITD